MNIVDKNVMVSDCVDCRKLNKNTEQYTFPMSSICHDFPGIVINCYN